MRTSTLVVLLCLSACSSPPADPDGGSTTDAPPPLPDVPPPPGETVTVSFGPDALAVGDERTVCIVLDAGNDEARQVRAIRTSLPTGSHHMIVYRTNDPVDLTPTPCLPFATAGEAVFIAETVDASVVYPPDVGLEFEAHQHVRLEVHEVNYTGAPIEVRASATFEFYPDDGTTRTPVQFLFTGNMSFSLPARTETTEASFHIPPDGARIFALTSHTHALGTHVSIHRATSRTAFTTLLHESTDWANPPLDSFTPPLELAFGEGLRLECVFNNTTDSSVSFGLDFADEMCFLWAYYY